MTTINPRNGRQMPAVDPKLGTYIETALACLEAWARGNGQNWEALTDPHALLLKTLLTKSKREAARGATPIIPLGELQNLMTEELTGRKWEQFLNWFGREIERSLEKNCAERAEKLLYPGRSSNGRGGRGTQGKAIYFLSFDRPIQLEKPARESIATANSTEQKNALPEPKTPPRDAECGNSSGDGRERPVAGSTDDAAANPDSRGPKLSTAPPSQTQHPSVPLGLLLSLPAPARDGSSVGWLVALALALVLATFFGPAGSPLMDEIVQALSAVREALSGEVIVRL